MKLFFKFLCAVFLFTSIISCETDKQDLIEETGAELQETNDSTFEKLISDPECTQISGELGPVCFTGERTYSVVHPFGSQASIKWTIRSGNGISIEGSSTSINVVVRFNSQFNGGELQVVVGNCISIVQLGVCSGGIQCPTNVAPSRPGPITFDIFLGSQPTTGNFCTNTVANVLWISNVECAVDYIWTISPSIFGTKLTQSPVHPGTALLQVSRPGEYVVSVKSVGSNGLVSPERSISLLAENCSGGGLGGF
ncbi:hypothetical protein [uncultured Aquimarina sp.]|uniref:hypothetical protein n=1 Tax=uncultured Aquimarina sp. TaxID=575652 RepID=UPI002638913D|nr:hypothetical protein [uncultured Aquimarina sp.]